MLVHTTYLICMVLLLSFQIELSDDDEFIVLACDGIW